MKQPKQTKAKQTKAKPKISAKRKAKAVKTVKAMAKTARNVGDPIPTATWGSRSGRGTIATKMAYDKLVKMAKEKKAARKKPVSKSTSVKRKSAISTTIKRAGAGATKKVMSRRRRR